MREVERAEAYGGGGGSHIPLLASVVAITRGPVLEVGTGDCSAPLLAEMCAAMGRTWMVIDHKQEWLDNIQDLEPFGVSCAPTASDLNFTGTGAPCGVCFVDSSPPLDRLSVVKLIRPHVEFIVIHDTDNASGDLGELLEYLGTFPHRYDYTRMQPHTTVVSDVRPYR